MTKTIGSSAKHIVLDETKFNFAKQRVVIIGDVHGCLDETKELIEQHTVSDDVIIFVGDLVNKGPKSAECIKFVRENNFLCVKGNHDVAAVRYHQAQLRKEEELTLASRIVESIKNLLAYLGVVDLNDDGYYAWQKRASRIDLEFLDSLPFTISIPYHNAVVVHAGLVPDIKIEDQKDGDMISMRNIVTTENGLQTTSKDTEGEPWASIWKGIQHVFFGHDAKRMLQQYEFATGLDTGCVYGKQLTAAILNSDHSKKLVHVSAKEVYEKVNDTSN